MRRAPSVVVITPRIGPGLNGGETITALGVGQDSRIAGEIRIERRVVLVAGMVIAAGGVALPDFDHGVGHRLAVLVEHPAMNDDALAERLDRALLGEVVLEGVEEVLDVVFLATPPEVSMELGPGFLDAGAKVNHLSYIGDASIGAALVAIGQRAFLIEPQRIAFGLHQDPRRAAFEPAKVVDLAEVGKLLLCAHPQRIDLVDRPTQGAILVHHRGAIPGHVGLIDRHRLDAVDRYALALTRKLQQEMARHQQEYQLKLAEMERKVQELIAKYQTESKVNNQKNATNIALANINNASRERVADIQAGAQFNGLQAQLEHEQVMSAIDAINAAVQDIRQHGIEIEQQAFQQQAGLVQAAIGAQQAAEQQQLTPPQGV